MVRDDDAARLVLQQLSVPNGPLDAQHMCYPPGVSGTESAQKDQVQGKKKKRERKI